MATCSGPNVAFCEALGADEVVDYRATDVVAALRERAAGAGMFDLIVDNVFASHELYFNAHHYLRPAGTYVTIAGAPTVGSMAMLVKAYVQPGFLGGGKRPFKFLAAASTGEEYPAMAQWMLDGKLKVPVEEVFDLGDAGKAFEKLKGGRTKGKLVIKVGGEDVTLT